MSKKLITLGDDGELALKSANGTLSKLPEKYVQMGRSLAYLVIDCSGSMTGKKILQAKRGSLDFTATAFREEYSVGLISFSDSATHLCSPTDNTKELALAVDHIKIQGGTDMTPAIEEVIVRFKNNTDALRVMIIVTDGQTTNPQAALNSAEKAKRAGISILTIGTDDADFSFLSKLASDTNLAKKVTSDRLEKAISDVARMLPHAK